MPDLKYGIKLKLAEDSKEELRRILASIGDDLIRRLSWKVQLEFFVIHHESEFARNAEFVLPVGEGWIQCRTDRRPWSYDQFERFSREVTQVIDAEFAGYKSTPKGKKKWIVLKAVDGSFWELWTESQPLIGEVSAAFIQTEKILKSAM